MAAQLNASVSPSLYHLSHGQNFLRTAYSSLDPAVRSFDNGSCKLGLGISVGYAGQLGVDRNEKLGFGLTQGRFTVWS